MMNILYDERPFLMSELDETTMREIFERLLAIEGKQNDYDREQAVLKVEFLGVVKNINEKLIDIAEGRNKNCMEHKAELAAMKLLVQTLRQDFDNAQKAHAKIAERLQDKISNLAVGLTVAILGGIGVMIIKAILTGGIKL